MAFAQYFTAKSGRIELVKSIFNAEHLDQAFIKAMKYIQSQSFGAAIGVLSHGSHDNYETFLNRETKNASTPTKNVALKA